MPKTVVDGGKTVVLPKNHRKNEAADKFEYERHFDDDDNEADDAGD